MSTRVRLMRFVWRMASVLLIGLAVVLIALRGISPAPRAARIVGGSMAPGFIGRHYKVTCGDCRFPFVCDADDPPDDKLAVCPNCGYQRNRLNDKQVQPGQQVLVDTLAYAAHDPQRWDVVAVTPPDDAGSLAIKRVVGLPGEQIAIRHGDIYVNQRLLRKSLREQRAVANLVHDDLYRPKLQGQRASRWQSDDASRWRQTPQGYQFEPAVKSNEKTLDWLTYRHWPCYASIQRRAAEAPVKDDDGYNQGLSRQLYEVSDLMLSLRLRLAGRGTFAISIHDGRDRLELEFLLSQNRFRLRQNDKPLADGPLPSELLGREALIEFSVFDRQAALAIDGRSVFEKSYDSSPQPFSPVTRPISLGAAGVSARVTALRVLRDIYYLGPRGAGWDWSPDGPLAQDEIFLLGDNVPISIDSRRWPVNVTRKLLTGRVLGVATEN